MAISSPFWAKAKFNIASSLFSPTGFAISALDFHDKLFEALSGHQYHSEATWRSGDAADCKSVYAGSIPAVASIFPDKLLY